MIDRDNYITICGWMTTELGLKGIDLITYAVVYSFSQKPGQVYDGSASYIADWGSYSTKAVLRSLKYLTKSGYLEKKSFTENHITRCEYVAIKSGDKKSLGGDNSAPGGDNLIPGGDKKSPGAVTNNHRGGDEMLPNNNKYIHIYINNNNIYDLFEELWSLYPKKASKKTSQKAFEKAIKAGASFDDIKSGVIKYADQCRRMKTDTQYIKHFSTFLNQECWNDEYGPVNYQEDYSREANILDEIDFTKL